MNVYKIIDIHTPYCGGMAIVAANNEQEAIDIFNISSCLSDGFDYDEDKYYASLLENIISPANEPCFITEEWYYE